MRTLLKIANRFWIREPDLEMFEEDQVNDVKICDPPNPVCCFQIMCVNRQT